jgi:hypothetical protein
VLRNPDGTPHKCEDPYLWQSKRGWHLITHNQQGPQSISSYGYSIDGHHWTLSPTTPHTCGINYTDGTTADANGCGNRPQIVWSERAMAGGSPQVQWLYANDSSTPCIHPPSHRSSLCPLTAPPSALSAHLDAVAHQRCILGQAE